MYSAFTNYNFQRPPSRVLLLAENNNKACYYVLIEMIQIST